MTEKIERTKITSEDCVLPEMQGKYDLVFYASQRARAIINGSPVLVDGFQYPRNHSILVALEEIRQGKLTFQDLMESLASPFTEESGDTIADSVLQGRPSLDASEEDEDEEESEEEDLEDEEEIEALESEDDE